eukprot:12457740-Alexandrium_andersonii.AAC.1
MGFPPAADLPRLLAPSREAVGLAVLEDLNAGCVAHALEVAKEELPVALREAAQFQLGDDAFPQGEELHGGELALGARRVLAVSP